MSTLCGETLCGLLQINVLQKVLAFKMIYKLLNELKSESRFVLRRFPTPESVFFWILAHNLLPSLTNIDIINKYIEPFPASTYQGLANALKTNTTLKEIRLVDRSINDDAASHFAEALKINKTLTILDLSGNRITSNGARILGDVLMNENSKVKLNLVDNYFGGKLEDHLIFWLPELKGRVRWKNAQHDSSALDSIKAKTRKEQLRKELCALCLESLATIGILYPDVGTVIVSYFL